ncbi:MAG: hypothetical protein HY202_07940 [Nitrospirae bacterium]|nr:hypothetical protein [Nitrospirota bacterium]
MYRFVLKRLSDLFVLFLLGIVSGCGGGGDSSPPPPPQKTTTDQIVVIKPGEGSASILPIGLPQPLFQSSAVTYTDPSFGNSYIYVIGGAYIDPAIPDDPVRVNTVYTFQIDPGTGSVLSRRIEPQLPSYSLPGLRGHTAVIYNSGINSAIYVMGGIGGRGFQKTIYKSVIIPPSTPTSYPDLGPWNIVGYLPVEETGHASVVSGNWLYVIGGIESGFPDPDCVFTQNCQGSPTTVFSNKIYGYNLTSGFSTSTAYTMPKKLFTPSAVAIPGPPNDQIWVLGGWDGTANSTTAYLFNVSNGLVSPVSPTSPVPDLYWNGISKAVGLFLSGQMFLIGGVSGSLTPPDEILRRNIFSSTPSSPLGWNPEPSLPQTIEYFSAASAGDTIYVFGGLAVTP